MQPRFFSTRFVEIRGEIWSAFRTLCYSWYRLLLFEWCTTWEIEISIFLFLVIRHIWHDELHVLLNMVCLKKKNEI